MPLFEEMSVELVDMRMRRYGGQTTLEILVDKRSGGITVAECSVLNRKIGEALEVASVFAGPYMLEVSSPGIDRPLRTKNDFLRTLKREVRIFLSQPVANRIEYEGTIEKVEDDRVIVNVDEEFITIPLSNINKAKQII